MLVASITLPGTTGQEEPPGITAFSFLPFHTPPASASKSAKGMPNGSSRLQGFATCPDMEKITVPPELAGPRPANQAAPLRRMVGTEATLWVLLMVVGLPNSPKFAGNGGLKRGLPGLPSSDSSNAVSSPQLYAPAPMNRCRSKSTPEPRIFLPSRPAS